MPRRPSLLVITNEAHPGDASGQVDGFRELERAGELGAVASIAALEGFQDRPDQAVTRVVHALAATHPDVVLVLSPGDFPGTPERFDQLKSGIGSATLLYWEGDAWHRSKPVTASMTWWLSAADIVFSVCGQPLATEFLRLGAKQVNHVAQTYCHQRFARCEAEPPGPVSGDTVTMVGNNLMRVPGLTGLPGSVGRVELALRLRRRVTLDVRGYGWSRLGVHASQLAYRDQADHVRSCAASTIWDHMPKMGDYTSDRLPIALVAGRAHVMTRHPGMRWAPGPDVGLFFSESPAAAVATLTDLLADPTRLTSLGQAAHDWAAHRVSHREAARYMISEVVAGVAAPPADPWAHLPGPWTRT